MLFKLSLKNIKKSIKDYGIYFFTLVFAVSIFYIFNSIDAQTSMMSLNESKYEIIQALIMLIEYVSVFVSVILGFLIVYSNKFLIKRRKKEIGLYEILGMSKRKISLILLIETTIIGILSLVVGLLIGVFLSQFLSIFISKLFEVNLSSLKFVFSVTSFNKTILYFAIIFVVVLIFNVITLNKYKIIDLINADKKNEKIKVRNKYLIVISFILSALFLGYAYYLLIHEHAMVAMDNKMLFMIISGSIGTFLLFFSLSGFLLKLFKRIKKLYYKNLNIFTFKQVDSKANSTVISTSLICLMLLLTIGMLSGSISMASIFNNNFKENNLTDYTVNVHPYYGYYIEESEFQMKENEIFNKFDEFINGSEFNNYSNEKVLFHKYKEENFVMKSMISEEKLNNLIKEYGNNIALDYNLSIIKESEYKNFMKITNQSYIDIQDNEYLLLSNMDIVIDAYSDKYENDGIININGNLLKPASDKIIKTAYYNAPIPSNDGLIVVSDDLVENLDITDLVLVGNFNDENTEEADVQFQKFLHNSDISAYNYTGRVEAESTSVGTKTIVIFLGLYLGITFAVTSATVLAIGQLSESSDNKKRYKILNQIGADEKMINKALFTQIGITFAFPLVVALIHSYFGLRELNNLMIMIGDIDIFSNILLTSLFMIIIYGGYFLLTYILSKNLIRSNQ